MPDRFYEIWGVPDFITTINENFYDFSQPFKMAADILLKYQNDQAGLGYSYSEREIMPILFLIRQYIELMLKAIIFACREKPDNRHNLSALLRKINELIPQNFVNKHCENAINELGMLDAKGDAFRYPTNICGEEHFPQPPNQKTIKSITLQLVHINFFEIKRELERIYEFAKRQNETSTKPTFPS